jgi:hypothetical protein
MTARLRQLRLAVADAPMLRVLVGMFVLGGASTALFYYRTSRDINQLLAPADRARDARLFTLAADMYAHTACTVTTRPIVMARVADMHRDHTHNVELELAARTALLDARQAASVDQLDAATSIDDLLRVRTLQLAHLEQAPVMTMRSVTLAQLCHEFAEIQLRLYELKRRIGER